MENSNYLPEISIRYKSTPIAKEYLHDTASRVAFLRKLFDDDRFQIQEETIILFLDDTYLPIGFERHARGTRFETPFDWKRIIQAAVLTNAGNIIIAHNHPLKDAFPSETDMMSYTRFRAIASYFEVGFLDDIILTEEDYFSTAEHFFPFNVAGGE